MGNVYGQKSGNDNILVIVQSVDLTSRSEGVIGSEMSGFAPPIHFGSINGVNNPQNPQQYFEYSRDYNVGSTLNASNSMAVYRQNVEESHNDLVNLLTQQRTTILNPMMADHESKFEHLARQVERIARIVEYKEGERHDARGNNEGFENFLVVKMHEVLARLRANHGGERYQVTRIVEVLNRVGLNKVAYVTMESSEEELDLETEVDLAERKKGPPYRKASSSKAANSAYRGLKFQDPTVKCRCTIEPLPGYRCSMDSKLSRIPESRCSLLAESVIGTSRASSKSVSLSSWSIQRISKG
ncbi:hypothetical protein Ahy_A02g008495 [Arachis hypogaea]|uniref:Uncharacterized protein n=1 Tax=Arachis hypogaea TaxID=3818 RepID=A0A445EEQ8_ARAHY|nr:hypothetical protein Ahy_A02g008495 [Arachis hypogaea]